MNPTFRSLLLMICFVVFSFTAYAQVNEYNFTSAMGTYNHISGGTVHGTSANDNECFLAVPLGFNFFYNGVSYTTISIATNGFIAMGNEVITSNVAISAATGTNNVIAALNRDIKSRDEGELMSLATGVAPNRVFTVQWAHYRRVPTTTVNDDFSFQIRLLEANSQVQIVYGAFNAVTQSTAAAIQVGLRGNSNTDFNNRATTTNWAATTAGTANNASCTLSATVFPAHGLTFTWFFGGTASDLAAMSVSGPSSPVYQQPSTYNVTVYNAGAMPVNTYYVKLMYGTIELASVPGPPLIEGAIVPVPIIWTPQFLGEISIYGKVVFASDPNPANDDSPPLAIVIQEDSGEVSVTIGDGTQRFRMPLDFYYRNSLYETLYYPGEIGMYGNITSLKLYNDFASSNLANMPVKIWMGTTQLADLSAGWITSTNLTLVYDGTMDFPFGQNTITFPLIAPFSYSGGNLVVLFNRPMDTEYYSSSDFFKCQTQGTNRARNMFSDSITYDPAAPQAVGTLTGQFPMTTFTLTPLSPDPVFAISPASYDFGTVLMNSTHSKSFTIMNAGGGTLSISNISISGPQFYTLQNVPTLPVSLGTGQSATFAVQYNPTVTGNHIATVSITDNRMLHTVAISGTSLDATIYSLPYSQTFDAVTAPALPIDWSYIYQATATTGYVKTVTTSPQSAPNCVAMYNPTDINTVAMLIAPPLANAIATNTVRVKFWGKGAATYAVKVGVMTDPADAATFTEVQSITLSTAWVQYAVTLTTYTGSGKFIAFKHANNAVGQTLYLDTVELEPIAPNDLAALSITGNITPNVGGSIPYTITVFNNGTANQSAYNVKLFNSQNVELASAAGVPVNAGEQVQVIVNWTPSVEGPMTIYGKVLLPGDVNTANDQTPNLNITVVSEALITFTIGTGDTNARMPLDFFYKNSLYETLYYPNEIGVLGNIVSLSIYNQFTTTTLTSMPTKIWMGVTQLPDLSAGWIPSTDLTLVFDGNVAYPGGANTIVYPLLAPFQYAGGNLVVMFNRPMDTVYYSSSDYFKCQTVGTNRARNMYSDSTVFDPASPTGGTLTGLFPMTTIAMTPLGGEPELVITPPSKDFGTVLLNSTISQNFMLMNGGGGSLTINSISVDGSPMFNLQGVPTLPASLTTGQSIGFTAVYHPIIPGQHTATINITDDQNRSHTISINRSEKAAFGTKNTQSRELHTVALSGNCIDATIYTFPHTQNFDAVAVPNLPLGWNSIYQATVTSGYVKTVTTSPHTTPNCVAMYNPTDPLTIAMLIAPPLDNTIEASGVRVKFFAKGSASYAVKVGVMTDPTDPATFTELQTINLSTAWAQYTVPLTSYTGTGKFIAFKHANSATGQTIYLDTMELELISPNDLAAMSLAGNVTPTVGVATTHQINIFNNGTASQSTYTVKLFNALNVELATAAGLPVDSGQSVGIPLTWIPSTAGPMSIYGKVFLDGDINTGNDQTPAMDLTVQSEGVYTIMVGDGSQNARIPMDFYWKNSLFETLYYASELDNFTGMITGIQLFNEFITNLPDMPTKIWLGTTTQNDLSAGWIPSTELIPVYDGIVTYPTGTNIITITFSTPFMYTSGQNLVMMVKRPMDTAYYSSSDYFKAQTDAVNTARARNVYSDTVDYDPAAPSAPGTASGQFPKTSFFVVPGSFGQISGTVSSGVDQPMQDVLVQILDTAHAALTGLDGDYLISGIVPGNYIIRFTKTGFATVDNLITITSGQMLVLDVTMTPSAIDQTIPLSAGWNLFSLNVSPADHSIATLIAPISTLVQQIKGTDGVFIPGNPYSTLTSLTDGKAYNILMSATSPWIVSGAPIPVEVPIALVDGWNMVAYTPQYILPVEDAMYSIADWLIQVKGTDGVYIPDNPYSTLTTMYPGKGYWIKINGAHDLLYPMPVIAVAASRASVGYNSSHIKQAIPNRATSPTHQLTILPTSMTVLAKCVSASAGDILLAKVNGELRGKETIISPEGFSAALVQIYSDTDGEELSFSILTPNGSEIPLTTKLLTLINGILGSYPDFISLEPMPLDIDDLVAIPTELIGAHPNPFSPSTTISFSVAKDNTPVTIEIYNIKGQKVRTLLGENLQKGSHSQVWNGTDDNGRSVSSGTYIITMKAAGYSKTTKALLIK